MLLAFDEAACADVEVAGGKGASLARMTALGMPVPPGFVVPADALEAALAGTAASIREVLARGVRMMGIDAITFDPPVWAMFERKQFWEAHRVMWDEEYWHLENLMNLELIGRPHGFKLCVLPIKWTATTAAPVRAIAIVED